MRSFRSVAAGVSRPARAIVVVAIALVSTGACSGEDEPSPNQITRIDGPATVDGGAGADQEGAALEDPPGPPAAG